MDRELALATAAVIVVMAIFLLILLLNQQTPGWVYSGAPGHTHVKVNETYCGDGRCDSLAQKEDCFTCRQDCGACAGPKCPDGLPEYAYKTLNPVIKNATLEWLGYSVRIVGNSIENLDILSLDETNITARRDFLSLHSVKLILFSELSRLYNWTDKYQTNDSCSYLSTGPMANLYSSAELMVAQVDSTNALQNKKHCIHDYELGKCLDKETGYADMILDNIKKETFDPDKLSENCSTDFFSSYMPTIILGKIYKMCGVGYVEPLETGFNRALSNAHKKSWEILAWSYENTKDSGDEKDDVLRIVAAENIIQYNNYYMEMWGRGCA